MIATLLSLAVAATALHLEEANALSEVDTQTIEEAFALALESAGRTTVHRDVERSRCAGQPKCLAAIRARTGAKRVVLFSIVGGVTRVLMVAELFDESGLRAREQASLPLDASLTELEPLLRELVARLAPRSLDPGLVSSTGNVELEIERSPGWSVATWTTLSIGSAAIISGVVLAILGARGRAELGSEARFLDPSLEALSTKVEREQIASVVLLSSGMLLAAATAVVELARY